MGFAEETVKRFYKNMVNGLTVLLDDKSITEDTTIKELLDFCKLDETKRLKQMLIIRKKNG